MSNDDRPSDKSTYDGVAEAKHLLRSIRAGALATLSPRGLPFASLVNVATDADGSPILLLSQLALHTSHVTADPRASLLLARAGKGDPLTHPRLTVSGILRRSQEARHRARFLCRHPKAGLYADFADFGFWILTVESLHLNGGFGKAGDFDAETILTEVADAQDLIAAETAALAHLNDDHGEALRLYATQLAAEADGPWRASGLDPEGLDLMHGERTARVVFGARVTSPSGLRSTLKQLADLARRSTG